MKQTLYRIAGKASLTWQQLASLLLNIEISLINFPLGKGENEMKIRVQLILTPNVLMFGQPNHVLKENEDTFEEADLQKTAKCLHRCKDQLWSR